MNGVRVLTIEQRKHVYADSPYTSVPREGGHVKIFTWEGNELIVDPRNGAVVAEGYGK